MKNTPALDPNHGCLYQLRHKWNLTTGQAVAINGPYDRYGYVVSVKDTNEQGTLYLLRGTGYRVLTRIAGAVLYLKPEDTTFRLLPQF